VTYATDDEIGPATWQPPRALGLTLAVAATGCLVTACFSHHWLIATDRPGAGYSPLEYQQCAPACTTSSNFQVFKSTIDYPFDEDHISRGFPVSGAVAFIALMVAAAGLLTTAAIAFAHQRPDLPMSPTTVALVGLLIGLISGCVFVGTKPPGSLGVSWGFLAFGVGAVTGIAATYLLARQIRPRDPDLLHDAMNLDQF